MDRREGWGFLRSDDHGGPWRLPECAVTERAGDRDDSPLLVRGTGAAESSVDAPGRVPQESTTSALCNRVRSVTSKVKGFLLFNSKLIYQLAGRETLRIMGGVANNASLMASVDSERHSGELRSGK